MEFNQGRRRVFKSGPAEKVIEVRRHKRGRAREGINPPLVRGGGWGASPEKNFEFFSASMCIFNGVLCVWDQILVVLVTKIFLVA